MSVKEDVLFCKIAISSGLVKEADAQKVLALCDKRERESGRRPLIGALFEKYNLLDKQSVQRVYQAIQKRTGGAAGPERRAAAPVARGRGTATRRRAEPNRPKAKIDQNTLLIGIGSLVVLLGVLGVMFYKLMEPAKGTATVVESKPSTAPPAVVSTPKPTESVKPSAAKPAEPKAPEPKAAPPATVATELPKEKLGEILQRIADVRSDYATNPAEGLKLLEAEKKSIEASNRISPSQLNEAIQDFDSRAKEAASTPPPAGDASKPSEPPKAGEPAKPDAEVKPEEQPKPDEMPKPDSPQPEETAK